MATRPTIAVVDDKESVRKALGRLLATLGVDPETFASGGDFLASLESRPPDCALLDIRMPGVNGFTIAEQLAGWSEPVPFVFISDHGEQENRDRADKLGVVAWMEGAVGATGGLPPELNSGVNPNKSAFGLGDLNYSGFFSPAKAGPIIWGVGPSIMFPTATDPVLGSEKWSAGPSIVILANWQASSGNRWTVPVGGGIGRIFNLGTQPVNARLRAYYNVARPAGAPEWSGNASIAFLFPR